MRMTELQRRRAVAPRVRQRRDAFTVIEIVTVVGIIGVLVSVLTVGIQRARESSRRLSCTNHLRQMMLAVQLFEKDHGYLPSALGLLTNVTGSQIDASGMYRIMPYIELTELSKRASDFEGPQVEGPNLPSVAPVLMTRVEIFLCPSDPIDLGINYRFNTGSLPIDDFNGKIHANGPFRVWPIKFSRVDGGLSNTAAFAERRKASGGGDYDRQANVVPTGVDQLLAPEDITSDVLRSIAQSIGTAVPPVFYLRSGHSWHSSGLNFTTYNHVFGPGEMIPSVGETDGLSFPVGKETIGAVAPSSHHSGGFNLTRLDGSTDFMSTSVDFDIWQSLGSVDAD